MAIAHKVICGRVKEWFESMDYEEKRLGFEALNICAAVTDDHVEVEAGLGVDNQDSRLLTTLSLSV